MGAWYASSNKSVQQLENWSIGRADQTITYEPIMWPVWMITHASIHFVEWCDILEYGKTHSIIAGLETF